MFMVKARSMLLQKGTLLCRSRIPALSRGFRFSRQSLFSPDLYEGSRTDRRVRATLGQIRKVAMFCDPATRGETAPLMHVQPYPSPVSGLEKVFKGGDLLPVSAITLLIAAFILFQDTIHDEPDDEHLEAVCELPRVQFSARFFATVSLSGIIPKPCTSTTAFPR